MDSCYRQSQLVYCLTNVTTKYQITFPPIPENIPNSIQPISYIISYLYARFTRFPISYCGAYMVDIKYIYPIPRKCHCVCGRKAFSLPDLLHQLAIWRIPPILYCLIIKCGAFARINLGRTAHTYISICLLANNTGRLAVFAGLFGHTRCLGVVMRRFTEVAHRDGFWFRHLASNRGQEPLRQIASNKETTLTARTRSLRPICVLTCVPAKTTPTSHIHAQNKYK